MILKKSYAVAFKLKNFTPVQLRLFNKLKNDISQYIKIP
jgi:hypothetical protein